MSYPNNAEIQTAASTLGIDPIVAFAYSAMHGRVPASSADLAPFETSVQNLVFPYQIDPVYGYGYVQANGALPVANTFLNWLTVNGYRDATTGQLSGHVPFAGEGYPPGNQPTDPMPTTASASTTPPSSGPNFSGLLKNPLVLAGGGLFLAWQMGLFHRR